MDVELVLGRVVGAEARAHVLERGRVLVRALVVLETLHQRLAAELLPAAEKRNADDKSCHVMLGIVRTAGSKVVIISVADKLILISAL